MCDFERALRLNRALRLSRALHARLGARPTAWSVIFTTGTAVSGTGPANCAASATAADPAAPAR